MEKLLMTLRSSCPGMEILTNPEERLIYAHGCYPREYKWLLQGPYPHLPRAIVLPRNTAEVSTILKLANQEKVGIIPFGGGSGIVGGSIAENGEIMVDIRLLEDFTIDPISMTATGGAGIVGADFENRLNCEGYTAGQYPQSFQSAVLGGMVATRAIGTFSTKYGKMDDMVNSLEVVLPTGEVFKSHRTPKASSGPNLDELFLGSEGIYGIVTAVEMKIYPQAEVRCFEAYTFPSTEDGLTAIRGFVQNGINPAVVRLYDEEESIPKIKKYGFPEGHVFLVLGYEGLAKQVAVEREYARAYCAAEQGVYQGEQPGIDWFHTRFSTKKMLDHDATRGGTADAIEVAAPWSAITDVWREMRKALAPLCTSIDCHFSHVYHTGASVYVIFHAETGGDDKAGEARYLECLDTAIRTSIKHGGNVSHHHGSGKAKAPYLHLEHGESGIAVMANIKKALDPQGILNKGVLVK